MTTIKQSPVVDKAIAAANDLPSLVQGLQQVDPALAQQLTGKALIASKSMWGTFAVPAVVYVAGRYGLNWDHDLCTLVAGGLVLICAAAFRKVTSSPITSWVRKRVPTLSQQGN